MKLGVYLTFFLFSTVKFMFKPFAGPTAQLSFVETYIACVSGATTCATFFYFLSGFFMKRAQNKRIKKHSEALEKGQPHLVKKKFTTTNKIIVKTKKKLGIYGIALYAPFFLSVPIGSIVAAKFYQKDRKTLPLIVVGLLMNGLITTGLAYFLNKSFISF